MRDKQSILLGLLLIMAAYQSCQIASLKNQVEALSRANGAIGSGNKRISGRHAYLIETGRYVGEIVGYEASNACGDCWVTRLPGLPPERTKSYQKSTVYIKDE